MSSATQFGFNVISHVSGNLGIGVTARNVLRVLIERGCPVSVLDIDPGMGRHQHDRRYDEYTVDSLTDMPYGINLFILPPSTISHYLPQALSIKPGCLNVAWSMWELPVLPEVWRRPLEMLDVLIAQSEFVRYAFEFNLSHVQTIAGVHPLYLPDNVRANRTRFGLPAEGVIFVTSFDPHSDPQRKNPFAAVRAFLAELGDDPRAHLVIKMNNAHLTGAAHPVIEELLELCNGHARVRLLTENLSYSEVLDLYASCDVFVSLHRAEGLGLGPMEAMALGKAVIATGWSGNMTYMNHRNACPVGYQLIPVAGSIVDYNSEALGRAAQWADPDMDQASAWMRRLVDDAALRVALGECARTDIAAHHARAQQGSFIEELRAVWEHHVQLAAPSADARSGARQAVITRRSDRLSDYLLWNAEQSAQQTYQEWLKRRRTQTPVCAPPATAPLLFHVVVRCPLGADARLADSVDTLGQQNYPGYCLSILADTAAPEGFEANAMLRWYQVGAEALMTLNEAVREVAADWVMYVEAGDLLAVDLLSACAVLVGAQPDCRFIYTDEDVHDGKGRRSDPNFKPDFNLDLLRSTPYIGAACMIQRAAWIEIGGCAAEAGDVAYDLALKVLARYGEAAIGHVAELLWHRALSNVEARARGPARARNKTVLAQYFQGSGTSVTITDGMTADSFYVDYLHREQPHVTILVPTRDRLDVLAPCLESLLSATAYPNFDVLVINNNSKEAATLKYLDQLCKADARVSVFDYPDAYNFAAINNAAAQRARGEYLLLLNNDTVVIQANWLSRMMAHGQRPEVGIVGARLIYLNRSVQHAGIVLGMGAQGVADHAFIGLPLTAPGYQGRALTVQNYSAVTAACLLIRKSVYAAVGGMDEQRFKVMYNDVDLCLKVERAGHKIVWTPFVTLIHHGSASLKENQSPQRLEQAQRETDALLDSWLPQLARDRSFNPHLALAARSVWSTDPDLDTYPSPADAARPRLLSMGLGSDGSYHYRGIAPLEALRKAARADCLIVPKYADRVRIPSVADIERLQPQALLLYNTIHDDQLAAMARYKRHNEALRIFSMDDLASDLPQKNPFRSTLYKDIKKRIRSALALCDRLIVTTAPLGEAFRGMIDDIRVVPNYLEAWRWDGLQSQHRRGGKPRVGWAGALQHQGDLELIIDVVNETADEVDWIFFGMCPAAIRDRIAEFHAPVGFDAYPAKLASLDLDLAVAPLEHNKFNEAKSNLRLLEYGVLGWPVVCTNIHPYQDAPVERVANNTRAWLAAIRARTADLDAAAAEGQTLRRWVLQLHLLENHLDDWLNALSGANRMTEAGAPARYRRPQIVGA